MLPLDWDRFIFALAGALHAAEWSPAGIRAALRRAARDRPIPTLGHAGRLLRTFPQRPDYAVLLTHLRASSTLRRGAERWVAAPHRVRHQTSTAEDLPPGLQNLDLSAISTAGALAGWLGLYVPHLYWLADVQGRNRLHAAGPLRTYRYRWVPRRQGPPRLLEIPKARLKQVQRNILAELLDAVPVHPATHGFCRGRSIVSNAATHCGKAVVLRFDLQDFFPSITAARVRRIFGTLGYPDSIARLLAGLCTTRLPAAVWESRPGSRDVMDFDRRQRLISRHLPQGAPTSPALANLAAHRLDRRLSGLARAAGVAYTRYADDLTFSGGPDLARGRLRFEAQVAAIASEEGFRLNHQKTRFMRAGVRQQVAGVVVNVRPNVRRADYDALKAILTNCVRHGPTSQNRAGAADFRSHLAGRVAHVSAVHRVRGEKLRALLDQIQWPES